MTKAETKTVELIYDIVKDLRDNVEKLREKLSSDISGVYNKIDDHSKNCSTQRELTDHKENHKDNIKNKQWTTGQVVMVSICIVTLVVTIFFK